MGRGADTGENVKIERFYALFYISKRGSRDYFYKLYTGSG